MRDKSSDAPPSLHAEHAEDAPPNANAEESKDKTPTDGAQTDAAGDGLPPSKTHQAQTGDPNLTGSPHPAGSSTMETKTEDLYCRRNEVRSGDASRIERQHQKGKLTARERISVLLDEGTFRELGTYVRHQCRDFGADENRPPGDSVVTGFGKIHGRLVYVFSQDFTVMGGSLGRAHADKIVNVMEHAMQNGAPIIGLNDSGGARIQEGIVALGGYADIVLQNTLMSGVVPQISAIMGPCAGGAAYSPAITDLVFMVKGTSNMFVTGPRVVSAVMQESTTFEDLGGAFTHTARSGVAHSQCTNDVECLTQIRKLMAYLPQNCEETPPTTTPRPPSAEATDELASLIPSNPKAAYDMKAVIERVVDKDSFFEVHASFATNLICGFARAEGRTIGVLANQPLSLAGVLNSDAAIKGARFVRFCDSFNIPVVVFEDVPGFLPGKAEEWQGIIRHGAKFLFAFCEATVPRIAFVLRKAYGGAYAAMNSKHFRGDLSYAWPTAEVAVMGPEGAVEIIYRSRLEEADDPDALKEELIQEYRDRFANPYVAAERGYIDDVIAPEETRAYLVDGLEMLKNKVQNNPRKKHGNIPL